MNPCPVCGFQLDFPADDFNICPCCGTEFGYSDSGRSYKQLRAIWLQSGAHWFDTSTGPPQDWNPYLQIDNIVQTVSTHRTDLTVYNTQAAVLLGVSHHGSINRPSALTSGGLGQTQNVIDISGQFKTSQQKQFSLIH